MILPTTILVWITMYFKQVMKEQAELYRIQRGFVSEDEKQYFTSIEAVKRRYPEFTKRMSLIELEMLWEKMQKGLLHG